MICRLLLFDLLLELIVDSTSHASVLVNVNYTGTLQRIGNDPAGIVSATFELNEVFDLAPHIDNGLGQPSLPLLRPQSTFELSGASNANANGLYTPFTLSMIPTLGGALVTLPSNPSQFSRGEGAQQLRLSVNVFDIFGGNGFGQTIGQTPLLSHFPTAISSPTAIALPHNTPYTVSNPSVSASVIPEPGTFAIWTILGMTGVGVSWRRSRIKTVP